MNIRLANNNDMQAINELFNSVIEDLRNVKKIDMFWGDVYPFCEFESDILKKEMYVMEENNVIIGSFSLSIYDDPDYHEIKWKSNDKRWFYLNRLVVHPLYQGKGYAKQAINFIQNYAIDNEYEYIRLTVYNKNKYATRLYEKLGFEKVEEGFWQLEDKIFVGYEKKI